MRVRKRCAGAISLNFLSGLNYYKPSIIANSPAGKLVGQFGKSVDRSRFAELFLQGPLFAKRLGV